MRVMCCGSVLTCFVVLAGVVRGDDAANARAAVERALKAMGGDKIARWPAGTFQCKITGEQQGRQATLTGGGAWQGLDKLRFPSPVPVGSRIRLHATVGAVDEITGGVQVTLDLTVEVEGSEKPACIARALYRYYA